MSLTKKVEIPSLPKLRQETWQVCKGGCGKAPAMWVDGGIHANEWIGPAVATYMARWIRFSCQIFSLFKSSELIENDEAHSDLTEELDWYPLQILWNNTQWQVYSSCGESRWIPLQLGMDDNRALSRQF